MSVRDVPVAMFDCGVKASDSEVKASVSDVPAVIIVSRQRLYDISSDV